jgi:flagellar hook-basal body complex protein FliE
MTIPIQPQLPTISPVEGGGGFSLPKVGDGQEFGDLLTRALGDVQQSQNRKDDVIGSFLRMAAAEEASLSLQLLVETRNKLTDAYRTIMNMQV